MTRRLWIATLGAALCAGLLPACSPSLCCRNLFGSREPEINAHSPQDQKPVQGERTAPTGPETTEATIWKTDVVTRPAGLFEKPENVLSPSLGSRADTNAPRVDGDSPGSPLGTGYQGSEEAQHHEGEKDSTPAEVKPPVTPPAVVHQPQAPPPEVKKEPLLEALDRFLKNRPGEALVFLQPYHPSSQELYIRLLPVLAQLTQKNLDQLDTEEVATIHDQLQGVVTSLRSRARLLLDKMCFCEEIKSYGNYKTLAEDHTFRPQTADRPGDLVQVYVELRNFSAEPSPQGYRTRLSSSVEICDGRGKQWWYYDFGDSERPLYRQTLWHDFHSNYSFYVPHIPPGTYTLTIQVKDLTRPDAPRLARKTLEFRVAL